MRRIADLTVALAIGLPSVAAYAQFGEATRNLMIEQRFKSADKDADGRLTLEEAKAGMPRVAKNFDRIDSDRKGHVTVEQIKKAAAEAL